MFQGEETKEIPCNTFTGITGIPKEIYEARGITVKIPEKEKFKIETSDIQDLKKSWEMPFKFLKKGLAIFQRSKFSKINF